MRPKPSGVIDVRAYHLMLTWPLLLRGDPGPDADAPYYLDRWVEEFKKGGWRDATAADDGVSLHPEYAYEEVVYFHPFVRDFLFGDGRTPVRERVVRRLTRGDARRVRIDAGDGPVELRVERAELYLFKPNVAVLCFDLSNHSGATTDLTDFRPYKLAALLNLQDRLRRIYPPFWYDAAAGAAATAPGLCPTSVTWLDAAGQPLPPVPQDAARHPTAPRGHFTAFTADGAEPPVFDHWHRFLAPARPLRRQDDRAADPDGLYYQQVEDERIPAAAYFAFDNLGDVSEGDRDRITFFDAAGEDDYPYDPAFLARNRGRYTYDRFAHLGTTYYCCGYGFAAVGLAGSEFYRTHARDHFRQHYFRVGLIAHYQRAALLSFAGDWAAALKLSAGLPPHKELANPALQQRVAGLQMQFLKFRSRGYFPEVTNQVEGQELFALWFGHLDTHRLFVQVDETSQRLYEALSEYETRELSRSQERLARYAGRFLLPALVCAFLSVLFASDLLPKYLNQFDDPAARGSWVAVVLLALTLLLVGGALYVGYRLDQSFRRPRAGG